MTSLAHYSLLQERHDLRDAGYNYVREGIVAGITVAAIGTTVVGAFNQNRKPRMAALSALVAAAGLAASSSYVLLGLGIVDAAKRVTEKDGAVSELGPVRVTISAPTITGTNPNNATVERTINFNGRFAWTYR